jgi:hypothetical protein
VALYSFSDGTTGGWQAGATPWAMHFQVDDVGWSA